MRVGRGFYPVRCCRWKIEHTKVVGLARGNTLGQWLASEGCTKGLGATMSEMDARWREYTAGPLRLTTARAMARLAQTAARPR